MRLVTAGQMKRIDSEAINQRKIPGSELMESAGLGIAERIHKQILFEKPNQRIAIFCGKGNNGGDGFVIGRHLDKFGQSVQLYFLGPIDKLSADARLNFDRAAAMNFDVTEITDIKSLPDQLNAELIVDAIFGTGFSGAPNGLAAELISFINNQEVEVAAVDLPSGVNSDDGTFDGEAIVADYTFTLALPKFGLYLSPGRELSGLVEIVPIGIPDDIPDKFSDKVELITPEKVASLLPIRIPDGHKGDFGRLAVIAGSTGMTGAATLASEAGLRSGCGLLTIACAKSIQSILAIKTTEAMTAPMPDVAKKGFLALRGLGELKQMTGLNDAVVIGPGLGRHHETKKLIQRFIAQNEKPILIDADALFALSEDTSALRSTKGPVTLSPHVGEFQQLTGKALPENFHEKMKVACDFAHEFGVVLILKGSPTIIADPKGTVFVNQSGNSGMATGGSGDILSGIVGSFLAQGMTTINAAVCAVYIHGLAGDIAADSLTERALIAGDIIKYLPDAFELLEFS